LTDNNGKKADFRNIVLIMTNQRRRARDERRAARFGARSNAGKGKEAIEKMFSPEFRNRLDAMITFNSLSQENIERWSTNSSSSSISNSTTARFSCSLRPGRDDGSRSAAMTDFGARPMARLIQNEISGFLPTRSCSASCQGGGKVEVDETTAS